MPVHLNPLDKRMISKAQVKKRKTMILTTDRLDGGHYFAFVSNLFAYEVLTASRERIRQVTLEYCIDITGPLLVQKASRNCEM